MNWYCIKFTPSDIKKGNPLRFIKDFKVLYVRLKKLKGMALYKEKKFDEKLHYYYFKTPEDFPFEPIKLFAQYSIVKTFQQAVLKLEQLEGEE